jgi:hypothetical protein
MKTLVIAVILTAQVLCRCQAGMAILPDIPVPKLTPLQALSVAAHLAGNTTNLIVVSIAWCKASTFQSPLGDATYNPGSDAPEEYSWFVTYVYRDEETARELKAMNITHHFNSVLIERIKDNGKQGVLIGVH